MPILTQKKILNVLPGIAPQLTVHCSQSDTGSVVEFELYAGSVPFVPEDAAISVQGIRKDGTGFGPTACTYTGNVVSVTIDAAMTFVPGPVVAELTITEDGGTVSTANFALLVEDAAFPNGPIVDNSVDVYQQILQYVQSFPANVIAQARALVDAEAATRAAAVTAEATARANADAAMQTEILGLQNAVGGPNVAATVAAMTDTSKVYVYTGSEAGYTAGDWYYWNGSAWVSGGVYNSTAVQTDPTLSVAGMPADAAACGVIKSTFYEEQKRTDQLFDKRSAVYGKFYVRTTDNLLKLQNYCVSVTIPYALSIGDRIALYASGSFSSFLSSYSTTRLAFSSTEPAENGTVTEWSSISTKNAAYISAELTATTPASYILASFVFSSSVTASDAKTWFEEFAKTLTIVKAASGYPETYIPYYRVDVQEANLSASLVQAISHGASANTSYGVRWSLSDNDDLGERCFGAVGLSAAIGVGATDGASDFDNIYPWSEIKRCNIKANANGAAIVTYEGETGFALDGTNGDVFVRIPKFNVLRYKADGYEYRVIGAPGAPVHEAFVENGKELDEIFIGAFEGYIDTGDKLRSIGGVIPSSNETADVFLSDAQANGDNYSLYDSRCVDALWTLFAVEYGCRNTNHVLGYGLADFQQPTASEGAIAAAASNTNTVRVNILAERVARMPVGSNLTICDTVQTTIIAQRKITAVQNVSTDVYDITFDGDPVTVTTDCFVGTAAFSTNWCEDSPSGALSWHTGRNNWINNSTTQNAIRYRWVENVLGNLWHFLPDVTFNDLQMYVCKDMAEYVMFKHDGSAYKPCADVLTANTDNGSKSDTTGVNYWIDSLLDDTFAKFVLFGGSYDKALVSTQAFGAYYYLNTGTRIIANGGGFDHKWRCNMLTQRAWIPSTGSGSKWYLYGARLLFKKLT